MSEKHKCRPRVDFRELMRRGEALQRDAAASGRHTRPTAEDFALLIRAAKKARK